MDDVAKELSDFEAFKQRMLINMASRASTLPEKKTIFVGDAVGALSIAAKEGFVNHYMISAIMPASEGTKSIVVFHNAKVNLDMIYLLADTILYFTDYDAEHTDLLLDAVKKVTNQLIAAQQSRAGEEGQHE